MSEKINPTLCPLCGKPNDCALAKGKKEKACWCVDETFPEGIIDLIPREKQGKACICRTCLKTYRQTLSSS